MKNCFFFLSGNNGATYIFNTSHWPAIKESLKFYNAFTFKGKIKKNILTCFLFAVVRFFPSYCKSIDDIKEYLKKNVNSNIDFNLDTNSSVLISSTRDKVIVNHNGEYFHKFAFDKSFKKVQNESVIYKLLQNSKEFQVASLKDLKIDKQDSLCNFKLINPTGKTNDQLKGINNISLILVEFFNSGTQKETIKLTKYIENLLKRIYYLNLEPKNYLTNYFAKIQTKLHAVTIPLGLVHRDFKPWNTLLRDKLLIFDFEEAITNGPPLEDLLNYYIDPVIRYQSSLKVYKIIFSKANRSKYKEYLRFLNINIDFEILIITYTIERIVFWTNAGDLDTAKYYRNLLKFIMLNYKP